MPELSAAEIIATKLLGWTCLGRGMDFAGKMYERNGKLLGVNYTGHWLFGAATDWPDLTDWNDIRKMENAIDDKGLLWMYDGILKYSLPAGTSRYEYTATAEQRVAAALITIQEAGL